MYPNSIYFGANVPIGSILRPKHFLFGYMGNQRFPILGLQKKNPNINFSVGYPYLIALLIQGLMGSPNLLVFVKVAFWVPIYII